VVNLEGVKLGEVGRGGGRGDLVVLVKPTYKLGLAVAVAACPDMLQ
jgi:hypothetical protein